MVTETWCRLETPGGPSFGLVEGERVELVEGSPFASFTRTGHFTPLSEARLLVPVIPPTFYAIGSNYHDQVIKMAEVMGRPPVFSVGSVRNCQVTSGLAIVLMNPAGMWIHGLLSGGPASSTHTVAPASSERRAASTEPAAPAPTIT